MNYKDKFIGLEIQNFYCNGFFGREYDLEGAIIIASGDDWIVARTTDGITRIAHFDGGWKDQMEDLISKWCTEGE